MDRLELLRWLGETGEQPLAELWRLADQVRRDNVGDAVHLRGLIEISNFCRRPCLYCGIRAGNDALPRYRMTAREILACAQRAVRLGYGTVVLQSGEDPGLDPAWLADVIRTVKRETALAVTLSLGERTDEELAGWRAAGADRYLLRFESSNTRLLARVHPWLPGLPSGRVSLLLLLRDLGYEIGSGFMVGLPGQTFADLANDLLLTQELDLDMIGIGPYLPHPGTPLARAAAPAPLGQAAAPSSGADQVPNDELTVYKALALARLLCPRANIPSTTALASLNQAQGRELGYQRGANIVMPNLTPQPYRSLYEIYPAKARVTDDAFTFHTRIVAGCLAAGRTIGHGRGDAPAYVRRQSPPAKE